MERPELFQTAYASPQLELFELDDTQWRKVWQRDAQQRRERLVWAAGQQLALPVTGMLVVLSALSALAS